MENLVVIPGWGMSANLFKPVENDLGKHFNIEYCVWDNIKSVDGYLAEVENKINLFNGNCSLMGWSLGSLLAVRATSLYSNKIKSVISISGTVKFTRNKKENYLCGWDDRIINRMKISLKKDINGTRRSFEEQMFVDGENDEEYYKYKKDFYNVDSLIAGLDYLINEDVRDILAGLKDIPILLIHGEMDKICPVDAAIYIKNKYRGDVSLEILKDTGHIPFLTRKNKVIGIIDGFCEEYL